MDKVKYINHLGEEIDLRSGNIMSSYIALKNFVQSMSNNKLMSEGKSTPLSLVCLTKTDANRLIDVLEKDSINNVYGKFYINDWYIKVIYQGINIIGEYGNKIKLEVSLFAEDTLFTKETEYTLVPAQTTAKKGFNFPFNFPFNFSADALSSASVRNKELLNADFILKIDKPVSEVSVIIGDNSYIVDTSINDGDVFVLNTEEKKVYKNTSQGTVSVLGVADDTSYIFNTIPNGEYKVSWFGDFPLYITLLEHRRTPTWI